MCTDQMFNKTAAEIEPNLSCDNIEQFVQNAELNAIGCIAPINESYLNKMNDMTHHQTLL